MATKAEFEVKADGIVFTTMTNGDHIEIGPHGFPPLHLGQQTASDLAFLVNSGSVLTVTIKAKGE